MAILGLDQIDIQIIIFIFGGIIAIMSPLTAYLFKIGKSIALLCHRLGNLEKMLSLHMDDSNKESNRLDRIDKYVAVLRSQIENGRRRKDSLGEWDENGEL